MRPSDSGADRPMPDPALTIERLDALAPVEMEALVVLLIDAVDSGASVGFLAPLSASDARAYWAGVAAAVAAGSQRLFVARQAGRLVGSVQLELALRANGRHRAEVQKLFVLRSARGQGVARRLMATLEDDARAQQRTLLVLDTRPGDAAEQLYRRLGYVFAGTIPAYALSSRGTLDATAYYYKRLLASIGAEAASP